MKTEYKFDPDTQVARIEDGKVIVEPKGFQIPRVAKGQNYWYCDDGGGAWCSTEYGDDVDHGRHDLFNYFLTEAAAESCAPLLQRLFHLYHQHGADAVSAALDGVGVVKPTELPALSLQQIARVARCDSAGCAGADAPDNSGMPVDYVKPTREYFEFDGGVYGVLQIGDSMDAEGMMWRSPDHKGGWNPAPTPTAKELKHYHLYTYAAPVTLNDAEKLAVRDRRQPTAASGLMLRHPDLPIDLAYKVIDAYAKALADDVNPAAPTHPPIPDGYELAKVGDVRKPGYKWWRIGYDDWRNGSVGARTKIRQGLIDNGYIYINPITPTLTYHDGGEIGGDDKVWSRGRTERVGWYRGGVVARLKIPGPHFRTRDDLRDYKFAMGLEKGQTYYPAVLDGPIIKCIWRDGATERKWRDRGLVCKTKKRAEQKARAMWKEAGK